MVRVIPFGIIWFVFGCLFLWIEYAAIGDLTNTPESAIKLEPNILFFALTGITIIGLLVGFIELKVLSRFFAKKSFLVKISSKFIIYLAFFFLVILINYPIAASIELDTSILDRKVWDKYFTFFLSITHLSAIIQLSFSLFISLLYAEISDNLGQNVLLNFFTGKYHKPVTETRIFMFADMKSSTSIAGVLGHIKYFEFLRSYYFDLSEAILKHYGEVYQYIGDEIVVSWTLRNGVKENNCVRCFFNMKSDLLKKKDYYIKEYSFFPDFKAALHFGEVTTGEIGALKKEIFFTGDVLNTASRIQALCSELNEDLLISDTLANLLNLKSDFDIKPLGVKNLKGKSIHIEVLSIKPKTV